MRATSSRTSGMGLGKIEWERGGLKRRNVKEKRGKGRKRGRNRRGKLTCIERGAR